MMQCTDIHDRFLFRLITKKAVLYTEMITTGAILHGDCIKQLKFNSSVEHPVAIQLGGSNPEELSRCTKICSDMGYDEINLNVGCPSNRVQKGLFGACLMQDPQLLSECILAMQESTMLPVTVKCRIGINNEDKYEYLENFVNKIINDKMTTLIIHARVAILNGLSPRQNRQIPPLKYENVYKLKNSFPDLEVVINGGIRNLNECLNHLKEVDGVMLGRAAYDNPMITSNVDSILFNANDSFRSRKEILKIYLEYCLQQNENGHPFSKTLKHIFGMNKGMNNAKKYRRLLLDTIQTNNLKNNIDNLISMV